MHTIFVPVEIETKTIKRYYPNVQTFDGEHRMNQKVLKNVVVPIIKKLEECRCETEKGTICSNLLNSLRK